MATKQSIRHECDVLVIGAGTAGSAMARQIRLEHPDLHVMQIDARKSFDHWIGESTVEAYDIYMSEVLGLGHYLEKWYVEKHGLRFFYDSPNKDAELQEMSEFGRDIRHHLRASQLDRALLDTDMCQLNAKAGVDVLLGTRVLADPSNRKVFDINIDATSGHVVATTSGSIRCRWLIDSGGRTPPVAQTCGVLHRDPRHPIRSFWGRWEGCEVIDALGDDAWRRRVNYTHRFQSTSHFMYDGYWVWLIPLTHDVVSIGITFHPEKAPLKFRDGKQFETFLRKHRALDQILGAHSNRLDFQGFPFVAQYTSPRFSSDRWYVTGMASGVCDPLHSNASRMWPETNCAISDLIHIDRSGDAQKLKVATRMYDDRAQAVYEGTYEAYRHYDFWGSFDVHVPFATGIIATYWNSILPDFYTRFERIREKIDAEAKGQSLDEGVRRSDGFGASTIGRFGQLAREFLTYVRHTGNYHVNNLGKFQDQRFCEMRPAQWNKTLGPRDIEAEHEQDLVTYEYIFRYYVNRMTEMEGRSLSDRAFRSAFDRTLDSTQRLEDVLSKAAKPVALAANG